MEKGLEKVFKFYSNQQQLLGKNPSFEMIQTNSNTLSKGKFLKFCKDFGVEASIEKVLMVFKKTCNFASEMDFQQFKESLTSFKGDKTIEEYYQDLGFGDPKVILNKCTPFSKKHLLSLPQISNTQKKRFFPYKRTENSEVKSRNTKSSAQSKKSFFSNLPSTAIFFPSVKGLQSRNSSYSKVIPHKPNESRNWDDISKIETQKMIKIYGNLGLTDLIIPDQSDDEVLDKFGY